MPSPPLAEQRRIVAEIEKQLTRLDVAENQLKSVRAKLRRYASASVQEAYAQNFPMKPLKELASIKGGLTMHAGRPNIGRCVPIPYLRVANVQRGFLDLSVMQNIMATSEEVSELVLRPGDVLFTEGGDRDQTRSRVGLARRNRSLYPSKPRLQGSSQWSRSAEMGFLLRQRNRTTLFPARRKANHEFGID